MPTTKRRRAEPVKPRGFTVGDIGMIIGDAAERRVIHISMSPAEALQALEKEIESLRERWQEATSKSERDKLAYFGRRWKSLAESLKGERV